MIIILQVLYSAALDALETIRDKPQMDRSTVTEVVGLLANIAKFQFMLTVAITKSILTVTKLKAFAEFVQTPTINLLQFRNYAESVHESLKDLRSERHFSDLYDAITETVENQGIAVPTTIRKRRRGESKDAKVFYR